MHPLTLDDVVPLEEYVQRRAEYWVSHRDYRNRYRRVKLGPSFVLLFENRQTLWFRMQEILRMAHISEPDMVQQELDWFNQLLPGRDQLQAAWVLEIPDGEHAARERRTWQDFSGHELQLKIGPSSIPAELITCRPADRVAGTAGWLEFAFAPAERELLADFQQPAILELEYKDYCHSSGLLNDDVRQSLLDDLELGLSDASAKRR